MSTPKTMKVPRLVNIALPIWKRLEYLPHILKLIEAQDYPAIELIVSDNGENGTKVLDAVKAHYSRPFRFRQNPQTVSVGKHFNQIFEVLTGEYVSLICDDDEISSNYISTLVGQLEAHPEATLAFARQEIMNEEGVVVRGSKSFPAKVVSGLEFNRRLWQTFDYGFEAIGTFVARSAEVIACGGYPDFVHGNAIDNALVIKLSLNSHVVLDPGCVWRWRVHESGFGWAVGPKGLAAAHVQFIQFLDEDPTLRKFAVGHPSEWRELKSALVENEWQTYLWRWRDIYKDRVSRFEWIQAAFAMPFIPAYYRKVAGVFLREAKAQIMRPFRGHEAGSKEVGYFERDA